VARGATAAASRQSLDLEAIDRLEEKIKLLVGMVDRLRADNQRAAAEHARIEADNQRLVRELDSARARLTDVEGTSAEIGTLREERELIRSRVAEMLQRIEALNL
jgi:predicted RNase H-like nuclease (RuvC/YqgF family)